MSASLRDRATRPADQAPAGLGDTASVPSAASMFKLNTVMDCLRLLYRNGVNDGLRDSVHEKTRGEDRCIQEAADFLVWAINSARGEQ